MNDYFVNGILYLARLKMGLPVFSSQPDPFSVQVTLGNQQCVLTPEELQTHKLTLHQNLNRDINFTSIEGRVFQNSNREQPLDLCIKKEHSSDVEVQEFGETNLDQIKIEKCDFEDISNDSFSNGLEMPDNPTYEQVTSEQYFASTESNASSSTKEQMSVEPSSSKELEDMKVFPETSQVSTSAAENEKVVDDSTKVEGKKEHTSTVNLGNNQRHNSNHSGQNYYSSNSRRRCYFCHEIAFHRSWNCPKRRDILNKTRFSPWAPFSTDTAWKSKFKPSQDWRMNNRFNNAPTSFGQNNAPAKRGTYRRVYEALQNCNQVESNQLLQTKKKSKKVSSAETNSHHKILFQGEWYNNRVAADAELYLNKKEEVSHQIKREHRDLDEGFEDIQQVLSDDEHQNENPVFAYNKLQWHFRDEDNDHGGSSASFSTAA